MTTYAVHYNHWLHGHTVTVDGHRACTFATVAEARRYIADHKAGGDVPARDVAQETRVIAAWITEKIERPREQHGFFLNEAQHAARCINTSCVARREATSWNRERPVCSSAHGADRVSPRIRTAGEDDTSDVVPQKDLDVSY